MTGWDTTTTMLMGVQIQGVSCVGCFKQITNEMTWGKMPSYASTHFGYNKKYCYT